MQSIPQLNSDSIIGDYRLVREIGRGGMGIVYEARQVSLGRRVALKVLPFASLLNPTQLARFENEARAAAGLHHEHIVPVYGIGCDRGTHFYAMQFVDGLDLSRIISASREEAKLPDIDSSAKTTRYYSADENSPDSLESNSDAEDDILINGTTDCSAALTHPLASQLSAVKNGRTDSIRAIARLIRQAALALEYAHQQGVIHRDVKPSNLMIDSYGKLWLTDFGLARIENESGLTMTGDVMGTLRYMSPEQTRGRGVRIDQRTDIYSLGATLYELLTFQPLFNDNERAALLRKIVDTEPIAPTELNPAIPDDLETIILKATAKETQERYQTAGELADDLQRYLDQKPILAKRPSMLDQVWKWSRRHRDVTIVSLAFMLMLMLLTSFSAIALSLKNRENLQTIRELENARKNLEAAEQDKAKAFADAQRNADAANRNADAANRSAEIAQRRYYALALHQAYHANKRHDPFQALKLLEDARPDPDQDDIRGFEWYLLHHQLTQAQADLSLSRKDLYAAELSPTGDLLAVAGAAGTIWLIDVRNNSIIRAISTEQMEVNDLAFTADGTTLASSGDDGSIRLWDLKSFEEVRRLENSGGKVFQIGFINGGAEIVSTQEDALIQIWNVETRKVVRRFERHKKPICAFEISPDGALVASSDRGYKTLVWRADDQQLVGEFISTGDKLRSLAFLPDGRGIISGHESGRLRMWNYELKYPLEFGDCLDPVMCLDINPGGDRLLTTDFNGAARLWELPELHDRDLDASKNQAKSASQIQKLLEPIDAWIAARGRCYAGRFTPDGDSVLTVGQDGRLRRWLRNDEDIDQRLTINGQSKDENDHDFAICPISGKIAVAGDKTIRVYESRDGQYQLMASISNETAYSVVFTIDGRELLTGHSNGYVHRWNAQDFKQIDQWLVEPKHHVYEIAVSPDGRSCALRLGGTTDDEVRLHDIESGKRIPYTAIPEGYSLRYSPDGRYLAFGSRNDVVIWNLVGEPTQTVLPEHGNTVRAVRFNHDGSLLVTGSTDRRIVLWDVAQQKKLRELTGHATGVNDLAFSPNSRTLISCGQGDGGKIWDVETGRYIGDLFEGQGMEIEFTPDQKQLVFLNRYQAPIVRDLKMPQRVGSEDGE